VPQGDVERDDGRQTDNQTLNDILGRPRNSFADTGRSIEDKPVRVSLWVGKSIEPKTPADIDLMAEPESNRGSDRRMGAGQAHQLL
jgi:hypothetical protein